MPLWFQREKASVLPLVALGLVVFLGVIGLSVDLNLLFNSLTNLKTRADLTASAALRAYWELPVNETQSEEQQHNARLNAALQRAKEVAAFDENLPFYRILLGSSSSKFNNLCLWPSAGCAEHSLAPDQHNGMLIPGTWYSAEPEPNCNNSTLSGSCPCPGGVWQGPCFRPLDAGEFHVNAFQVELKTTEDSPMPSLLARFVGQEAFRPRAIGTSALKPRRLVFALDLSGSMDDETDPPLQSETSYKLISPTCPARDVYLNWTDVYNDSRDNIIGTYPHGSEPAVEPFGWSFVRMPRDRNGDPSGAIRYKSDFECFEVPNDPIGPSAYLLNVFPRPNDDVMYEGPQPITRTINAIHKALNEMAERSVPGDMAGMILFDRLIAAPRYIPLTPPKKSSENSYPMLTPFDHMIALVDSSHPDHWQERLNHLAFVRVDPENYDSRCWISADDHTYNEYTAGCSDRGIFSNIAGALREADRMMTSISDWSDADNQVLLFSDMLANCAENPYGEQGLSGMWCEESRNGIEWALEHVSDYVIQANYVPKRITLNLFPSGSANLGFHTQLMPNGKKGNKCDCLTEEEARMQNLGLGTGINDLYSKNGQWFSNVFVDVNDGANGYIRYDEGSLFWPGPDLEVWPYYLMDILKDNDPNTTYNGVQNWYRMAAIPTGGLWAVTRDPCLLDPDDPSKGFGNVMDKMRAICRSGMSHNICEPPGPWTYLSPGNTGVKGSLGMKGWTDQRGRLFCDPQGRTRQEQLADYMKQILSQTPYSLTAPLRSVTGN